MRFNVKYYIFSVPKFLLRMKEEKAWHLLVSTILNRQATLAGMTREDQVATIATELKGSNFSLQYSTADERKIFFLAVMDRLNQLKGGRPFSTRYPSSFSTMILGIRNAGYTLEDIFFVLEKLAKDWLGTESQHFFRPNTLFKLKNFENYIAQLDKPASHDSTTGYKNKQSGIDNLLASASSAANGQTAHSGPGQFS